MVMFLLMIKLKNEKEYYKSRVSTTRHLRQSPDVLIKSKKNRLLLNTLGPRIDKTKNKY